MHMTRSGFIYFTLPDDYDEPDNLEDGDFVQEVKKDRKKKKKSLLEKKAKKSNRPKGSRRAALELLMKKTELQEELIKQLKEENTSLKNISPSTPEIIEYYPDVVEEEVQPIVVVKEESAFDKLLNDNNRCMALYGLRDQQLYQIAGFMISIVQNDTNAMSKSMTNEDQLLLVLDYLRSNRIENSHRPENFSYAVIENYLGLTGELFFLDTVKNNLSKLSYHNATIIDYKIFIENKPVAGIYFIIDIYTKKILLQKVQSLFKKVSELKWNEALGIRPHFNINREIINRMKILYPLMSIGKFQSLESARHYYFFVSALWNLRLEDS